MGTLKSQLEYFPQLVRNAFIMLNICFFLFFVSLVCVHLTTIPSSNCSRVFTSEVWEGCRVPVPFCRNLYIAKCDCAVLEMKNYSHHRLPQSFGKLQSLVKLGVFAGELEELPRSFGDNHKRMKVLIVVENKLKFLPPGIGKMQTLL